MQYIITNKKLPNSCQFIKMGTFFLMYSYTLYILMHLQRSLTVQANLLDLAVLIHYGQWCQTLIGVTGVVSDILLVYKSGLEINWTGFA